VFKLIRGDVNEAKYSTSGTVLVVIILGWLASSKTRAIIDGKAISYDRDGIGHANFSKYSLIEQ
jgi:hypothetical protein